LIAAGLLLEIEIAKRLAGIVTDDKDALLFSSIVQGGGYRRMGVMIAPFPFCAESDSQPS
jgi:hypothetical protein